MGWPGADALLTYGGALNDATPVVDPTTDLAAAAGNRAFSALAGITRTAALGWFQLIPNGTNPPTIGKYSFKWGNSLAVIPQPIRNAAGQYKIELPQSVTDEIPSGSPGFLGAVPLNLSLADGQVESLSTPFNVQCVITQSFEVSVSIWTLAGAFTDPAFTVDIWVY